MRGVDSSYHIWTNMSIERGVLWDIIVHSIHVKERYSFFYSVYIQQGYYYFELNIDVQKGTYVLEKWLTINVLVSSTLCFHPLLSYGNSPQSLSYPFLLRLCVWVLGCYKLEILGVLIGSLESVLSRPWLDLCAPMIGENWQLVADEPVEFEK